MLDPASPGAAASGVCDAVERNWADRGGLDVFRRLGGHVLIALDGTEYHCSHKIHCPHCSTRLPEARAGTEYFHAMLAATLVAPGHDKVVPLEPEFIVPQDGAEKQDCENRAAKRWLAAHGPRYAALDPIYLGDDLFSRQPLCQAVLARRRPLHLRLQAVVASADPGIHHRRRAAECSSRRSNAASSASSIAIAGCAMCRCAMARMR